MLVSGIERLNIRRRTMGGRNSWARKGRVIASSFRPYGYQFHKTFDSVSGRKVKSEGVKSKVRLRDSADTIAIPVPAIVSQELWDAAQEQLKANASRSFKPTRHQYMLRGRLRCARCGGLMSGWTREYVGKGGSSINWHYRCRHRYPLSSPSRCDTRNIEGPLVEQIIWNGLKAMLLDEKALFENLEVERKEAKRARRIIEQALAASEAQNRKDVGRLNRLLDLYTGGEIEKAVYMAKKAEVEQAIRKRQGETAELRARLAAGGGMDPDREAELRRLRAEIVERLDGATFEQKVRLLAVLQVECIYDDETGQVMMSGAFGDQSLQIDADAGDVGGPSSGEGSLPSDTSGGWRRARSTA